MLRETLPLTQQDVVLDAGCADGYMSWELAGDVKQIVGVDIARDVIDMNLRCQSRPGLDFVACDLHDMDRHFESETFTKIACFDVLEHVADVPQVLRNLHLVLQNDGLISLLVPLSSDHGHFRFDTSDFGLLLSQCGFNCTKLETISPGRVTRFVMYWFRQATTRLFGTPCGVDSFDQTRAFTFAAVEPATLKAYKILGFPVLRLLMSLDRVAYVPGNDSLLALARKETP